MFHNSLDEEKAEKDLRPTRTEGRRQFRNFKTRVIHGNAKEAANPLVSEFKACVAGASSEKRNEFGAYQADPGPVCSLLSRACCVTMDKILAHAREEIDTFAGYAQIVGEVFAPVLSFHRGIREHRCDLLLGARKALLPWKAAFGKMNYTKLEVHDLYYVNILTPRGI